MEEYIIFSPSKEMNLQEGSAVPLIKRKITQQLIQKLQTYTAADLSQKMKISEDLSRDVYQFYQTIQETKAKPAIETYQGLSFRQLNKTCKTSEFLNHHLRILSALYGPLQPCDPINPYRLDLTMPIKVEGANLKRYWKAEYPTYFAGSRVYNLASGEFSSLIDQKSCEMIQINFYEDFDQARKTHSATAKKLRGKLLNHLASVKELSEEAFQSFAEEGYELIFYSLSSQSIIYEKVN